MNRKIIGITAIISGMMLSSTMAVAQQTLTLEECRRMAIENDNSLRQASIKVEMAGIDRKIARTMYFASISGTGAYLHNSKDISLISSDASARLTNMGTTLQEQMQGFSKELTTAITSSPQAAAEYMKSPMWQTFLGSLSKADLSQTINALGKEIDDALHPDLQNVFAGVITMRQPVYAGGKIVAANRIASLAEELSEAGYDEVYQDVIINVDKTYWQTVSIAGKKELAEAYADLLHQMERDVDISVKEGIATESDALQIKVKANEADMLKTKAINGLALSKMLLCKQIGIDLNSEIILFDEAANDIPVPEFSEGKSLEDIYSDRPETRSLELASEIFKKKIALARADMLPKVALITNYAVTNPNLKNGFRKNWGGFVNTSVAVSVPIFHNFEALQKTRKAKAEATLYQNQLEDARSLINLQVSQLRRQRAEALEKLAMAESNLASAEENLRGATAGFEEGVINANTALAAQTAWLQAHSEYIDAGIEIQMLASELDRAEANHNVNK